MSPTMMRRTRVAVAAAVSAALVLAPLTALATPDASPAATPEPISATTDTQPVQPVPRARSNEFSLGQSLQIRVGPDAEPNSELANFRWSVNQLTVQGPDEGPAQVPVPERGSLLRSLLDFSNPPQDDGIATLTADMSDGFGLARTVSLWPQDEDPPIELEASFTLDGQPIEAWDLVGRSGEVSATYTLTNTSTQEVEVEVEDLAGTMVTRSVQADVPMVGITKMLIPQSYTGLRLKGGTFGADGRGNNQVQFISLPFRPISTDGTATFGWAARVQNATLPSLVVQVAPVFLPTHGAGEDAGRDSGRGGLGLPPPNLDPAAAQIQAGVAQLIEGLDALTAGGGDDPLESVEASINDFFATFGENIQNVSDLLDPANPDGFAAALLATQASLTNVNTELVRLDEFLTDERLRQLDFLAANWPELVRILSILDEQIPFLIEVLQTGVLPIDCTVPDPAGTPAEGKIGVGELNRLILGGSYQGHLGSRRDLPDGSRVDDAYTYSGGITAGGAIWQTPGGENENVWVDGGLPTSRTACEATLLAAQGLIPGLPQSEELLRQLQDAQPIIASLVANPVFSEESADQIQGALQFLSTNLAGIVTTLIPLTAEFAGVLDTLAGALAELQGQVQVIATGLTEADVDLPSLDAVITNVVDSVLSSPPGQQITGGLTQVGAGVGDARSILGDYLAQTIVTLQGVGERAGDVASDVDAAVVTVKADVAGLVQMAGTSPLPYGGDPTAAPEGTVLAGAFEFRVDAADSNQPNTGPRILVGLVALIGAGALSYFVGRRRGDAGLADAGPADAGPADAGPGKAPPAEATTAQSKRPD